MGCKDKDKIKIRVGYKILFLSQVKQLKKLPNIWCNLCKIILLNHG